MLGGWAETKAPERFPLGVTERIDGIASQPHLLELARPFDHSYRVVRKPVRLRIRIWGSQVIPKGEQLLSGFGRSQISGSVDAIRRAYKSTKRNAHRIHECQNLVAILLFWIWFVFGIKQTN